MPSKIITPFYTEIYLFSPLNEYTFKGCSSLLSEEVLHPASRTVQASKHSTTAIIFFIISPSHQILSCKFLYYHIFKTCFAFALTNWIIGPEMITVISVHTPNFPPNKTPVTTTKISNAIRTNLICQ